MFQALQERRKVEFRRQCLYAGIVASTMINIKLPKDTERVSPYDFFVGANDNDPEEAKLEEIRQNIVSAFAMFPNPTPEKLAKLRARAIKGLKEQGYEDAEDILEGIFGDESF